MPDVTPAWHTLGTDAALQAVASTQAGLSTHEAATRLTRHGPNRLRPPPRRSAFQRFFAQMNNVLIYVLLGSAVVTAALQHNIGLGGAAVITAYQRAER